MPRPGRKPLPPPAIADFWEVLKNRDTKHTRWGSSPHSPNDRTRHPTIPSTDSKKGVAYVSHRNFCLRDFQLRGFFYRVSLWHRLHRRLPDADELGQLSDIDPGSRADGGLEPAGHICHSAQRHGAAGVQGLVEAHRA